MNISKINFWLDAVILVSFATVSITGVLLVFGQGSYLVNIVHRYSGPMLVALLALHFMLHIRAFYNFFKNQLQRA
jgi:hypothetical protein